MTPFRFGAPARRMYATYHPGSAQRRPAAAVLLCNPYGQEAIRVHRLYRLLADRLARRGAHVLRFDYFATGESDGDDEDGEMQGWCEDIVAADAELRRRARPAQVSWFGARLGATLAAGASARSPVPPDRLLLWEPLIDGPAYVAELGLSHARATHDVYVHGPQTPSQTLGSEAIGFAIGAPLRGQLDRLDAAALRGARAGAAVLVVPPQDAGAEAALAALQAAGAPACRHELAHDVVWAAEEAMGSSLVPAAALQALEAVIDDAGEGGAR